MTTSVTPSSDQSYFSQVGPGSIQNIMQRTGKLPPVSLEITPLNPLATTDNPNPTQRSKIYLDRFLSYEFDASVMVPVDAFNFSYAAPDSPPIDKTIKVGDIATLYANQQAICTGIIDQVETETDREYGEKVTITGRNMMSQLEDQECVSPDGDQTWGGKLQTVDNVFAILLKNTRINKNIIKQNAPTRGYLFATEPGETKLAALQRYCEPLNIISWMSPNGQIKIGKPAMQNIFESSIFCSRQNKNSNVLDIKVTRNGTQIPGVILPIFSGSDSVQTKLRGQAINNPAAEPTRLRVGGHTTTKTVVVSNPTSGDTSEFPTVNTINVAAQQTNFPRSLLLTYAYRELARQNVSELQVSCTVAGHYNDSGFPYIPDTTYRVTYDRGNVDEIMYLYDVKYQLDGGSGQRTSLYFCRLNTIVSNQVAK